MAFKDLSNLQAVGSDLALTACVFKPAGVGVPTMQYGPAVSGVVRAGVGTYTVSFKSAVYAVLGGAFVNKPSGAAQYNARWVHSVGEATATIYVTDAAGTLTDIDLSVGGGDVTAIMFVKQNPAAVH